MKWSGATIDRNEELALISKVKPHDDEDRFLMDSMKKVLKRITDKLEKDQMQQSELLLLHTYLHEFSSSVTKAEKIPNKLGADNLKYRHISEFVIEAIHLHYAEDITLGSLANQIKISKNYLGHIFKNELGESFKQYLTRVRMEKAKQMIMEGRFYIYEIAERVGYSNIPYFTSQFKKYVGSNPTDLLKL